MATKSFIVKTGLTAGNLNVTNTDITHGNVSINTSVIVVSNTGVNTSVSWNNIYVGNSTVNAVVNGTNIILGGGATINTGGIFLTNTTAVINSNNVNAFSHTVGTSFVANSTVAQVASGNVVVNSAGVFVANSTGLVNSNKVNSATFSVGTSFTANSTLVNAAAINVVGQTNTATIFVTTSANVGANVQVTTSSITLGNGTGTATPSISVSNSTSNVTITSRDVTVGNFTANSTVVSTPAINVTNQVNTATFYATTSANVGANVIANTTSIRVGNSTSNSVLGNNTLFLGNSTVYATLNTTAINISNGSQTAILSVPSSSEWSSTNYFLHANGMWAQIPGNPPGGSDTQVQYANNGAFAASAGFTFNYTTNNVTIGNTTTTATLSSNVVGSNTVWAGNSTVNVVANTLGIKLANSTSNTTLKIPTAGEYAATNYFLHANGSWSAVPGTPPGGSTTHVQYNDGAALAGSAGFTFTVTGNIVNIANTLIVPNANVTTANISTIMNIGANVVANTTMVKVGNSTIYTTVNSSQIVVNRSTSAGSIDDIVATDGSKWIRFNSNPSAALYNPLVSAGDNLLAYSKGGLESGVLVIAPYSSSNKGIKIDAGGNVAIAQATATSRLTVNGNITATGNVGGTYVTGNGSALTSTKWLGASYTVSTSAPSGGNDGDFWFERVA